MSRQQREKLFNRQTRAFSEGTVESINHQWVFFDEETDEASSLEEYLHQNVEIFRGNRWRKGCVEENGAVKHNNQIFHLQDSEQIRIRKRLIYSFERLLDELNDDSFFQFVTTLNSLDFSVYDCLYSYNQLTFLREAKTQSGVNFFIFDNGTVLCSVQHHFYYSENEHDRFEFTLNTGKRIVIEKINSQQP
ncbi:DUF2777 domain-containing protein [Peribacillus cavernae]|uniref:DUF2777 domain-containing protein n=1 Tax=Peribacillus cavernae TaxID=1674310 RepID=A0A433HP58_9BACI|nr:DUF2777 domain-containing protein [Peribacillus cavernae]MDQ0217564.1 hypothetical protein [Peribacillus cavernae]RUQ30002.1 DUF2777 domain-containing protein [Peribacillus cavernae]